jgi:hypothetical protein
MFRSRLKADDRNCVAVVVGALSSCPGVAESPDRGRFAAIFADDAHSTAYRTVQSLSFVFVVVVSPDESARRTAKATGTTFAACGRAQGPRTHYSVLLWAPVVVHAHSSTPGKYYAAKLALAKGSKDKHVSAYLMALMDDLEMVREYIPPRC